MSLAGEASKCSCSGRERIPVSLPPQQPFKAHRAASPGMRGWCRQACQKHLLHAWKCRSADSRLAVASPMANTEHTSDSGEVLYVGAGVAVVDELDNDAPIGTLVTFTNAASGALMWRREDNLCYILLLEGTPNKGDGAVCCTTNKPQEELDGTEPQNKRDFQQAEVAIGDALFGQSTDFLGKGAPNTVPDSTQGLPLLNQQVPVEDREQILEALSLGIKAVDILTPVGRGQAQLITGLPSSGKTSLVLDSILGQKLSGVKCVYASVGASAAESQKRWQYLQDHGLGEDTHMIVAPDNATLGERYAALCAACSRGEAIRDAGGHSLVILDDISSMVTMWEHITEVVQGLRPDSISEKQSSEDEVDLVQYEGMLISAAAAQRRRFFSLLVQRAAKMHRRRGGGSMTLLLVLPGQPATGIHKKGPDLSKYKHLSSELRAKLEAKLSAEEQHRPQHNHENEENARTEVVEEFMSMADGQTVLIKPTSDDVASQGIRVDASASVSRIGGRAYPPALRELAKSARLELVQAADAQQFSSNRGEEETAKAARRAEQLNAALQQPPGKPVSVQEQVIILHALQSKAFLEGAPVDTVSETLHRYVQCIKQDHPDLLRELGLSEVLPESTSESLKNILTEILCNKS